MTKIPMYLIIDLRPHFRIVDYVLNSRLDFSGKVDTQSKIAILIILDGMEELVVCFWMEVECHTAKRWRIRAKTSSPETG